MKQLSQKFNTLANYWSLSKSLLFVFSCTIWFVFTPFAWSTDNECERQYDRWAHFKDNNDLSLDVELKSLVIAASNRWLQELNGLFDSNYKSEHFTNLLHFLFQLNVRNEISRLQNIDITFHQAPIVKNLEIHLGTKNEATIELSDVIALLERAKELTVRQMGGYIFESSKTVTNKIERIYDINSTYVKKELFSFPEEKHHINRLPRKYHREMIETLTSHFESKGKFVEHFLRVYGVGVGSIRVDAQFAARLSTTPGQPYGPVTSFNIRSLAQTIGNAMNLRERLQWLFESYSDYTSLVNLFKILRKNAGKPHLSWEEFYKTILEKKVDLGTKEGLKEAEYLSKDIRSYLDLLDMFGFLPKDWETVDSRSREAFSKVFKPNWIIYADIRALGARNYALIHNKFSQLKPLVDKALELSMIAPEKMTSEQADQLSTAFRTIVSTRRMILEESNDFLAKAKNKMSKTIRGMGLNPADYAIWSSGDDFFIVIHNSQHYEISTTSLMQRLKSGDFLGPNVRMAVMDIQGQHWVKLSFARQTVGRTSDAMKKIEQLELGYEVVAEYKANEDQHQLIVAKVAGMGQLAPIPRKDLKKIDKSLNNWHVTTLP